MKRKQLNKLLLANTVTQKWKNKTALSSRDTKNYTQPSQLILDPSWSNILLYRIRATNAT